MKKLYIPILKAEKDSSLEIPYQREGLYFSGSSKYRGLYSVRVSLNSILCKAWHERKRTEADHVNDDLET